RDLLAARRDRQQAWDAGELPDFDPATADIRTADWKVDPIPEVLQDRRVEITGPVDRKMVINALNAGARVFMADFEDSCAPTWDALLQGQVNLRDAVAGCIGHTAPDGRACRLRGDSTAPMVRPRGGPLDETHALVDGRPLGAPLFELGRLADRHAEGLAA